MQNINNSIRKTWRGGKGAKRDGNNAATKAQGDPKQLGTKLEVPTVTTNNRIAMRRKTIEKKLLAQLLLSLWLLLLVLLLVLLLWLVVVVVVIVVVLV